MVIVERQEDGTYRVRGRKPTEIFTVSYWPCGSKSIRAAASAAPRKWVDECVKVANDALLGIE